MTTIEVKIPVLDLEFQADPQTGSTISTLLAGGIALAVAVEMFHNMHTALADFARDAHKRGEQPDDEKLREMMVELVDAQELMFSGYKAVLDMFTGLVSKDKLAEARDALNRAMPAPEILQ